MLHLFPCAQQDEIQLSSNQLSYQLHGAESSESTSSSVGQEILAFYRTGSFITAFPRARRLSMSLAKHLSELPAVACWSCG